MTPKRIAELRKVANKYDERRLNECLDEIERLQLDSVEMKKFMEIIGTKMIKPTYRISHD